MLNKLKHLNIYRLIIASLITIFAIFLLNGLVALLFISKNLSLASPASDNFQRFFMVFQIAASLVILIFLPIFVYRYRFKKPSLKSKKSLAWIIGMIFVSSFLLGLFYDPLLRYFPILILLLTYMLIPLALISCPLAVWASLDLGKKIYISLFLYYASCLLFILGISSIMNRTPKLLEAILVAGTISISAIVIHILIFKKRYSSKTAYKQPKLLSAPGLRRIGFKLCLIVLGALLLFGIYSIFNGNWRPSPEYKELTRQEKALGLPKPDQRNSSDYGCKWDSWDETMRCNRQITLTYNDITKVGQIRDRIVANGWNETSYDEYIGQDRQEDALSADQISQGIMPKAASRTSYHFSPKPGSEGNICINITAWSHGDERNPTEPRLIVSLYGKTQGC